MQRGTHRPIGASRGHSTMLWCHTGIIYIYYIELFGNFLLVINVHNLQIYSRKIFYSGVLFLCCGLMVEFFGCITSSGHWETLQRHCIGSLISSSYNPSMPCFSVLSPAAPAEACPITILLLLNYIVTFGRNNLRTMNPWRSSERTCGQAEDL